jgi:hypothetical protein
MFPAITAAGEFVIRILAWLAVPGGVADKDGDYGRAHVLGLQVQADRSTDLAQKQDGKRKPRINSGVLSLVLCWYWTKAIALKRVPEHLHSCSQAVIVWW